MIRVFPSRNKWTPDDALAFVGDPPLFRPPDQPVKISCTFTWDIPESERLYRAWSDYYSDVELGGPAFGDPGGEFTPGMFLKEGVTITSRGCPKSCDWCLVPCREYGIRELEVKPGNIIQDNNILACSDKHLIKVFNMLRDQDKPIYFNGGLDPEFLTVVHIELLKSIKIGELWFACDYPGAIETLKKIKPLLEPWKPRKKRCYVLIGYDGDTIKKASMRLEQVYNLGFWPFAPLYQPDKGYTKNPIIYSKEWKSLSRTWSRPAVFKEHMKGQY